MIISAEIELACDPITCKPSRERLTLSGELGPLLDALEAILTMQLTPIGIEGSVTVAFAAAKPTNSAVEMATGADISNVPDSPSGESKDGDHGLAGLTEPEPWRGH